MLSRLQFIFSNQKIAAKFTLMLSLLLLGGVVASGLLLWRSLQNQAQNEITNQGLLLTETMNSVRGYTSNNVRPLLQDDLETSEEFISETVPAFSAREVFERFRQDEKYQNFFYTEATTNPMNPRDKADDFEADLLAQMQTDESIEQLTGYRTLFGENVYYIARPLRVGAESCLNCHSTPEEAPANLITSYGSESGFGWELNQIVAAQIIYVPASDVLRIATQAFIRIVGIFAVVIGVVLLVLNFMLRRFVISPIGVMADLAHKVSLDEDISQDLETQNLISVTDRGDELGELGRVFQRMAREVHERTQKLREQIRTLKIEFDTLKQAEEVEHVTGSDFFKNLQSQAKDLRHNRDDDEEQGETG